MDLIAACIDPELDNPNALNSYIENLQDVEPSRLRSRYFAGLDLGKQMDHSVLAVVGVDEAEQVSLVHKRQFPLGTPYPEVVGYAAKAYQLFGFEAMYVDKTGIGDAVVDEIESIDISQAKGVFFTETERRTCSTTSSCLWDAAVAYSGRR
jgi:hypothetical protein